MDKPKRAATDTKVRRVLKGQKVFTHDLWKLKEAVMKHNVSWKYRLPTLVESGHCHYYHSINDQNFQPNVHSTATGGHFHEVSIVWADDENGEPYVVSKKCGPAMRMVVTHIEDKSFRRAMPIVFERREEFGGNVVDDHTHDLEFLDSEPLSASSRDQRREEERVKVRELMKGQPVSTQAAAAQKVQDSAGSAATLVKE